jgi:hypothetical protein
MKTISVTTYSFLLILLLAVAAASCQKEESLEDPGQTTGTLSVYLTDGPGDFEKVLVQINSVEVKLDTSGHDDDDDRRSGNDDDINGHDDDDDDDSRGFDEHGQWDTLRFVPGVYDLLTLRNGVDTLLAQGSFSGRVRKIRLAIGSVEVVVDGVTYPVQMRDPSRKYVYIKIEDDHIRRSGDDHRVWLDFDVSQSIVEENGIYYLRPVLKPFNDDNYARLEGKVGPSEAATIIRVYNATDTSSALPKEDGEFKIRGLKEGTYSVLFDASNGYKDTIINNVQLRRGRETELPDIQLKK